MIKRRILYGDEHIYRYPKESIKKFNELKKDGEFLRRYELFEKYIDYETGEKVICGSSRWDKLVDEFVIRCDDRNEYKYKNIYFGNVKDINYEDYLKECNEIDKRNITIKKRNEKISIIEEETEKIKRWNDYVVFEGKNYGVPRIIDDKHRENDCFGDVIYNECCDSYTCKKCFECIHL